MVLFLWHPNTKIILKKERGKSCSAVAIAVALAKIRSALILMPFGSGGHRTKIAEVLHKHLVLFLMAILEQMMSY